MTATKNVIALAIRAKAETTYNAGVSMSFAGVDSVKPNEQVELTEEFSFDGVRSAPPGSFGTQRRNSPSGPSLTTTIPVELKGNGSGYATTSDRLPNLHSLLEAAGLSGSLNDSSWSFSYTPEQTTPTSIGIEVYARGELHQVSGAYADHSFNVEQGGPVVVEFAIQGTRGAVVTDIARPTVNYQAEAVIPPKAVSIEAVLNFGGAYTPLVKSIAFVGNREVTARLDLNDGDSHGGYDVGNRSPTYTIVIEAEALSTFDPYDILRAGLNGTFSFVVGRGGVANTFEWSLSQAQLVGVVGHQDENGTTATWELTIQPYVSDGENDNDFLFLAY